MSGSSLRIVVPALLVIVGSVPVSLPAHAADGTIVVQRQVAVGRRCPTRSRTTGSRAHTTAATRPRPWPMPN